MTYKEKYTGYSWIKVPKVQSFSSPEENYNSLQKHHIEETTFLISEVRDLASKLDEESENKKIIRAALEKVIYLRKNLENYLFAHDNQIKALDEIIDTLSFNMSREEYLEIFYSV